mmetsp:Transcript_89212/g.238287  ORF Transcript_89212/g.238287 Transcript_89212/m.238287 type:complete len:160 (+) Transcript_89212:481-960(+)
MIHSPEPCSSKDPETHHYKESKITNTIQAICVMIKYLWGFGTEAAQRQKAEPQTIGGRWARPHLVERTRWLWQQSSSLSNSEFGWSASASLQVYRHCRLDTRPGCAWTSHAYAFRAVCRTPRFLAILICKLQVVLPLVAGPLKATPGFIFYPIRSQTAA